MARTSSAFQRPGLMGRREALARCGAALLGIAASGCAPTFVANALYPEAAALDASTIERNLAAFVETILPGNGQSLAIARLFADPSLKLAPYRGVLVADLMRRARQAGAVSFERLSPVEATRVVQEGLTGGAVSGRLYNGGAFLAQVAFYGGLWNSSGACPAIGFEGAFSFANAAPLSYPDPDTWFAAAITADGNPA